ncbi:mercury methylation corrinoid protein HgcA [Pseudobacteroides cellulosolvens]|uniref:CO dehydrogenase/acetyl-CoA synthase delta subunit, TIM barrel n=1 Tax=Pseudobacteroides cellulosolvens ATCC 35603 = DSM 2933 TaxID=398512 RepID=A0A0L6JUS5_9FIRM|nr:mercury methylation corrinoid protein HgcA [Pseudobacteroides cellulosolvens]KNY29400.1 CO dehydrogenase/acetyl-CoA synthase delta subunit, TIM barrel [Pseudobacteroides cellulosolvens ATCC 35603 = DSM 2933]
MDNKSCCGSDDRDSKAKEFIKINTQISIPGQFGSLASPLNSKSCCCGDDIKDSITKVSTKLTFKDTLGGWKARWGINRMNYKVNPGIYAVGDPDKSSPVLVTANYKMTFDALRKELSGLSAWIMVLDTKGINVWCAAGKGTFGTKELITRIGKIRLNDIVAHRTLILPQLGAPGISAHEVTKSTGFKIVYGPVRATDIKEFIRSGMKATGEMRTVKFSTYDRLVLTPMELVPTFKVSMIVFGILFLLNLIAAKPFGMVDFYGYAGAVITGCVLAPVLLPWIPGKAFAWKGWLLGFLWAIAVNIINGWPQLPSYSLVRALGYMLILPAVSSFYAMNFTGSSTCTSFSGVLKEMKMAIPIIIAMIALGAVMILLNSFIGL